MILSRDSEIRQKVSDCAPELKVLEATNSHFCHVLHHKAYRLTNKYHLYIGRVATRTGKYSKRIETLIKAFKFKYNDPITVLCVLA